MKQTDDIPLHVLPDVQFLASDQSLRFGEHTSNHRINFYAIIWFTEDKGDHYIDFKPYPIKKDVVYLLAKNQVHSIPSVILPSARVIVFSQAFFDQVADTGLRQLFLPFEEAGISIPPEMLGPVEQLFSLLLLEFNGPAENNQLLDYLTIFLRHLYRFGEQRIPVAAGGDARMVKLFQLMNEFYKEKRTASFYAGQIGLTPKRINEILRKKAGLTISQLLYQLLLAESKRELFHGEYSIKEIAYRLGFSDQSYFARFFKKQTGSTPEQFREQASAGSRP